ncbi:hypothetical protein DL768_009437 [Monosporascus sp. mg162]|nr:hypothetical protein DL768_009437 [Monosporascus sp. mg162]
MCSFCALNAQCEPPVAPSAEWRAFLQCIQKELYAARSAALPAAASEPSTPLRLACRKEEPEPFLEERRVWAFEATATSFEPLAEVVRIGLVS